VDLQFAELAAEGDVLLGRDVLVAEEQHLPVDAGLVEVGDGLRVEGADAGAGDDFGPDGAGGRFEADRSVRGLHRVVCVRGGRGGAVSAARCCAPAAIRRNALTTDAMS